MDLLEMEEPARVNYILKQLIVECFSWGAFYVTVAPSQLYLKNTALFLRLGSPSTLICLEPRSFTKTLFLGNEKWHFENGIRGRISKNRSCCFELPPKFRKVAYFWESFCFRLQLKIWRCMCNLTATASSLFVFVTRMDTLQSGWTDYVYYTTHQMTRAQVYISLCFPVVFLNPHHLMCCVINIMCPTCF